MAKATNFEGQKLGRWDIIIKSNLRTKNGNILYECICECGTLRLLSSNIISMKQSKSCGCLHKEIVSDASKKRHARNRLTPSNIQKKKSKDIRKKGERLQELRKYIYKRDGYQCCLCDSNIEINAHHINGWNWSIDSRYEETNLITLCKKHHNLFHKIYGRGWNTKEQFEEFLMSLGLALEYFLVKFVQYKLSST